LIEKDPYNTGSGTKNSINEKETPEFELYRSNENQETIEQKFDHFIE
jgi:hypothetical protein